MLYVHVAESHMRELPESIRACASEPDPDAHTIKMLVARADVRGKNLPNRSAWDRIANGIVRLGRSGGGFRTPDPAVNSRLLYH